MNKDLAVLNKRVLNSIKKYQNLKINGVKVPTPYFINNVENIYKRLMHEAGIEEDLIVKTFKPIKDGKTIIGSSKGKGTPEQIQQELYKLKKDIDITVKDIFIIREFMQLYHIGLDCSGFVYNLLAEAFNENEFKEIQKLFAWADGRNKKATRAGVYIFDSEELLTIESPTDMQPLDILIYKDHEHMGIVVEQHKELYLTDMSIDKIGITFNRIIKGKRKVRVQGREFWTKRLDESELVIKRLPQLN